MPEADHGSQEAHGRAGVGDEEVGLVGGKSACRSRRRTRIVRFAASRSRTRKPSSRSAIDHDFGVFALQTPSTLLSRTQAADRAASTRARLVMLLRPGTRTVASGGRSSGGFDF